VLKERSQNYLFVVGYKHLHSVVNGK